MELPARLISLILICSLTACGRTSAQAGPTELNVAAASSLAPVLQEMEGEFSARTGIQVVFSFASTGHLAQQIRNGAPFDLFAAADEEHVDMLISSGNLLGETRTPFAKGVLALVTDPTSDVETLQDAFDRPGIRLVIANPDHAPYGLAARQALERSGLWKDLREDIVYAETVRQATQVVETGNAGFGLVALSTARSSDLKIIVIDDALFAPIIHVAAALTEGEDPIAAGMFLEFLRSQVGAEILLSHGLEPWDGG